MTRQLEFIFYGLVCFDPQSYGYRVMFPDGRDPAPYKVPPHACWIGVRDQEEVLTTHWPGPIFKNNFVVPDRGRLQIAGLAGTQLNDSDFRGRVGNLKHSDPNFEIDSNPDMMYDVLIDRGVLSAHQQAVDGMIVVKWRVEALDDTPVRLNYGQYWLELGPGTTQVILGNTGSARNLSLDNTDFLLFRKLAKVRTGDLPTALPVTTPLAAATVIHPIDEIALMCPRVDCSCVVSNAGGSSATEAQSSRDH
jgi:hypothetical protein